MATQDVTEIAVLPQKVSDARCVELAHETGLYLGDLVELTGVKADQHDSYEIDESGITFKTHQSDFIKSAPLDWQIEMYRDNQTAPQLTFPCTPAALLRFIDAAIGIHCFCVPDTFRHEVARAGNASPKKKTVPDAFRRDLDELLEKIVRRSAGSGDTFNPKSMPGTYKNLYELATKMTGFQSCSFSTFKSYQKRSGLCSFRNHSESTDYYEKLFPELFK